MLFRVLGKFVATTCLLLVPVQLAQAEEASNYVQCDGLPRGMGDGEVVARSLLAIGTLGLSGLAGRPESADQSKRRFGEEGVNACNAALQEGSGQKDARRHGSLLNYRIMHMLEAGLTEQAFATARNFVQDSGDFANDGNYMRSYGLSALELEAIAAERLDKVDEAEAAALRMAALSPYSASNLDRASHFIAVFVAPSPARLAFYSNLIRQIPPRRAVVAAYYELAGNYLDAANNRIAFVKTLPVSQTSKPQPMFDAQLAIDYFLAGKSADGLTYMTKAKSEQEEFIASGQSSANTNQALLDSEVSRGDELIALAQILDLASQGKMAEARAAFAVRPHWLALPPPILGDIIGRLRANAKPSELTPQFAVDPAKLRAEFLSIRRKSFEDNKILLRVMRIYFDDKDYKQMASAIRVIDQGRYLPVKQDSDLGDPVRIIDGFGDPQSEGLTLFCAYLARLRGKTSFTFVSPRTAENAGRFVLDPPEVSGLPADGYYNVADVIRDLEPRFPAPAR